MATMMQETSSEFDELVMKCRKIIKCDTARIVKPMERMFFIIGFKRNTRGDKGKWIRDEKLFHFDYIAEKTVASGKTEKELIASCKEYKRLCGITMEDYLKEELKQLGGNLGKRKPY